MFSNIISMLSIGDIVTIILFGITLVIAILFAVYFFNEGNIDAFILILFIIFFCFAPLYLIGNRLIIESKYTKATENGYVVYVDGTKIEDNSKIKISNYTIEINDDLKEIYVSGK